MFTGGHPYARGWGPADEAPSEGSQDNPPRVQMERSCLLILSLSLSVSTVAYSPDFGVSGHGQERGVFQKIWLGLKRQPDVFKKTSLGECVALLSAVCG